MSCIFCDIIEGKRPAQILFQDELVTSFRDISPVAPTHILIVPNKHLESVNVIEPADEPALGRMWTVARRLAEQEGIAANGYRLVANTGHHGGQGVFHLHMHLMGGQRMRYPLG